MYYKIGKTTLVNKTRAD